jgi:hypothetical protein
LRGREELPGGAAAAVLTPCANRQRTEGFRLGGLFQVNSLFHGFTMPFSLISSSNRARSGSRVSEFMQEKFSIIFRGDSVALPWSTQLCGFWRGD